MDINKYYRATSLEDAYEKLVEHPKNTIIGGGLWLKKLNATVETLIDLTELGLDGIEQTANHIVIGAMASLRSIEKHAAIKDLGNGFLSQAIGSIMGVALRGQATIGGSLAGKYPFSDLITPLLTMDVVLRFYPDERLTLSEFLQRRGKTQGILTHVLIRKEKIVAFFKKVANTELDFAILNIAISHREDDTRIAIGSRPGVGQLAMSANDYLSKSHQVGRDEIEHAAQLVLDDISFMDTNAASADYRRTLAVAYVKRGLREVFGL